MFIYNMARIPGRQKGAVLVIGLIFLLVITLIGITAMRRTTLDTKITSNYRSYTIAFEGAESALRSGESLLPAAATRPKCIDPQSSPKIWPLGIPNPSPNSNAPPDCTENINNTWWFSAFNWSQNGVYNFADPLFSLENNQNPSRPKYLIEYQSRKDDFNAPDAYEEPKTYRAFYRITARASTGQNSQSEVILQSVFAWRYSH